MFTNNSLNKIEKCVIMAGARVKGGTKMDIMVYAGGGAWNFIARAEDLRSAKMVATAIANYYKTACEVHRSGTTLFLVGSTE